LEERLQPLTTRKQPRTGKKKYLTTDLQSTTSSDFFATSFSLSPNNRNNPAFHRLLVIPSTLSEALLLLSSLQFKTVM
jgi:hypothetical protein